MNLADLTLLLPALVAGLLVVFSHVPLGREVVQRGIIFIDLAIAQIAGVGVIAARLLDLESPIAIQLFAGAAALAGALLLAWTDRRMGMLQEPLIGVMFVLAATGGLMLLAQDPHGGDALKDMLAGQILWVDTGQLVWSALILVPCGLLWLLAGRYLGNLGFYGIFAISITTSVQLVGVYLVFASLVIPALAARHWHGRQALAWALGLGASGFTAGLVCSLYWDLPAAPLIVWCLALFALLLSAGRGRPRAARLGIDTDLSD